MATETDTRSPFRAAFEAEQARREAERRARDAAERAQQEADLDYARQLAQALGADPAFLTEHALTLELRRYTVSLNHHDYVIAAYFEAGRASITLADKRSTPMAAPRKQQTVLSVDQALTTMANFLADET